ncbi:leucine-rich transmembrane protein [Anopheles darlingi]|uniref:Leucine-rich transmembrane protein n=1 Tax=Anopheles darlingi TaxID=43151 RepID=W5JE90_ANODA|nr:leucine-rich transmembrane protein [Anopheles darlingi]
MGAMAHELTVLLCSLYLSVCRFQLVCTCLVVGQLLAIAFGAEIMTAGIAGGGGSPVDRRMMYSSDQPTSSQRIARSSPTTSQQQQQQNQSPSTQGEKQTIILGSHSNTNSSSNSSYSRTNSSITSIPTGKDSTDELSRDAKDAFSAWSAQKFVNKPSYDRKAALDKRFGMMSSAVLDTPDLSDWQCPSVANSGNLECSCDLPHTLRCSGDMHGLEVIADSLRRSPYTVSLLDCTLKNVSTISDASIFQNVSLQGLVISSGEIKRVHRMAFAGIRTPLQALGLPNNALTGVPMQALAPLTQLDRLDLSSNRIKSLQNTDFLAVPKLSYLELSGNQISLITSKSLVPLRSLLHLKLNGNRLGESPESLKALEACVSLKELNLHSNGIKGPLRNTTLPAIHGLEILCLNKNSISSIHNGALEAYPYLQMLSLRNNQIDVLQDHAFSGLASLQVLDLGHNGIVTISGASLKHLPRLIILDLTHNFLRALTADVVAPLPALKELRLDGNDISLIAANALVNATQLHSLSLENNPLVCDCTMKPFLDWLAATGASTDVTSSRIASQDILGAICATPPHLEGAALLQVAPESMNCDSAGLGGAAKHGNTLNVDTFKTIEVMLKLKNNASYVKDISAEVQLRSVNFTDESDVFLYWLFPTDDYSCRFVYVFHDDDPETILFNSEVSCMVKPSERDTLDYIYSTKLLGAYDLQSDTSYKFCLIMKEDISKDEYLGTCQVATLPQPHRSPSKRKSIKKELQISTRQTNESDISDLDRISSDFRHEDQDRDELLNDGGDDDDDNDSNNDEDVDETGENGDVKIAPGQDSTDYDDDDETLSKHLRDDPEFRQLQELRRFRLTEAEDARLPSVRGGRMLLEGLGTIIIITSLIAFVWGFLRYKGEHRGVLPSMSTCYTVDERRQRTSNQDVESRSRYFKLQATTSL